MGFIRFFSLCALQSIIIGFWVIFRAWNDGSKGIFNNNKKRQRKITAGATSSHEYSATGICVRFFLYWKAENILAVEKKLIYVDGKLLYFTVE